MFVVLLALAHASVASTVAIWQGVNFGSFSLSTIRVGGITNPIPFSEMLMASLGIVAIYWSGYSTVALRFARSSPLYFFWLSAFSHCR